MIRKRKIAITVILSILLISVGLLYFYKEDKNTLFIATTTSIENTGVLDLLVQEFEKQTDISVKYAARGSGIAIDMGKRGVVDALLTHAPVLEKEFVEQGYGVNYTQLWYNFFIIIGPKNDVARLNETNSASQSFENIFSEGELGNLKFYSRGDQSGTHQKELELWNITKLNVDSSKQSWYIETGSGMSDTIRLAIEKNGYVLSDVATFVQYTDETKQDVLDVLFTDDDALYNQYSYTIVSPEKFKNTKFDLANRFLMFLLDPKTQDIITNYIISNTVLFTVIT